ncbi:S49 family peptidase [Oceanibacterium hippocampi]|uniref:Putative signal peptide peptidase SppA n=1 Tax=Oceanibacterium hippocampi TaxID=745714 RepID=A0A1Y5TZX0_9PROT|nr:S49 family peptidase [Oceanibacterium hippocampi]SLN77584.1 Putative signal peptide peptidase SppA [Oceanibacterium hippocampi]
MTPDVNYPNLLARLTNRPLLVTPAKARVILGVLAARADLRGQLVAADAEAVALDALRPAAGSLDDARRPEGRPFAVTDGVAVIPVRGTLVQRNGLDPFSGMTGYDGLAVKFRAALADPAVRGIAFRIDSPGGEVGGCFDLADEIFAARGAKPTVAILDENAFSAAYALASACDRITVPRTGGAGSIGVVTMHVDYSRALDADGITVTLIHAGAHKVDGHPFAALPDEVRADIQAEIDQVYGLFTATVARNRGLAESAVRATEARCFLGPQAVAGGLADAVASPEQAFAAFLAELDAPAQISPAAPAAKPAKRRTSMTTRKQARLRAQDQAEAARAAEEEEEARAAEGDDEEDADAEDGDEQEPEAEDGDDDEEMEEGDDKPAARAAAAERKRIAAILDAKEAKGRDGLARHLAFETRTSPKAARAMLAAAPKAAASGSLASAMASEAPNPQIGLGGDSAATEADRLANSIIAAGRAARGAKG